MFLRAWRRWDHPLWDPEMEQETNFFWSQSKQHTRTWTVPGVLKNKGWWQALEAFKAQPLFFLNQRLPLKFYQRSWIGRAEQHRHSARCGGINLKESWQAIKALFSWAVKSLEWIKLCWILVQTVISARGFGSKQTKPPLQGSRPWFIDLFTKFKTWDFLFCVKCTEQRLWERQTGKLSCIYLTGFCLLLGHCWAFPPSALYESLLKYQINFKKFKVHNFIVII